MSDALKRISELSQTLVAVQVKEALAEEELKRLQAERKRIETEDLPELMREYSLKSIELEDGSKVEVKEDVQCGITAANKEAAHQWLKDKGFGGLIKTDVTVEFGRDEQEAAERVADNIRKITNHPVIMDESIHWQTLKAFINEQREKGVDVPADLFSIFPFSKAKLTPPKKKKK